MSQKINNDREKQYCKDVLSCMEECAEYRQEQLLQLAEPIPGMSEADRQKSSNIVTASLLRIKEAQTWFQLKHF